ncbi:MAG: periplasmic heavy metal sensor [Candidatus Melainabacteria bacterium]|nr:periplasmic heavy metal sensor [Candidatus Melainabacteria bacterium]
MKLPSLLATVACLTALSLPSFAQGAQGAPDFASGPDLGGEENAEMIPTPPIEGGVEMGGLAFLPDEAMDLSAYPLTGSPSGGGKFKFTDEQLEKIYNLKNKLADESGPNFAELMKQKRHLKDLMTQEKLDRGAVQATQDKINKLSTELSNARLAFKMDMMDQLTPEQKQSIRYKSMKRGHGMRHGGLGARRGHGGPGGMHKNSH